MWQTVKVMILDDHLIVHRGLLSILKDIPFVSVLGNYVRSRELTDAMRVQSPDLLVLDFELHPDDVDGFTLIKSIKRHYPQVKILVVTAHASASVMMLAFRGGADGFCSKGAELDDFSHAIQVVSVGRKYLPEDLTEHQLRDAVKANAPVNNEEDPLPALKELSAREREVLQYILMGMSIADIANKFSRSPKTVSGHKMCAYRKLGISSDAELFKVRGLLR